MNDAASNAFAAARQTAAPDTPRGDQGEMSASLLNGVADWIMQAALGDMSVADVFGGACTRLLAAGVPVARSHMSYRTLHPSIESVSLVWSCPGYMKSACGVSR